MSKSEPERPVKRRSNTRRETEAPYSPAPRLSAVELGEFAEIFKKLVNDSGLKWWIIAAGIGAIIDAMHTLWLAARWAFKF